MNNNKGLSRQSQRKITNSKVNYQKRMLKLFQNSVLKDVEENSIKKHSKNISKYVEKYSNKKENLLKLMLQMIKQKNWPRKMKKRMKKLKIKKLKKYPNGKSKANS